MSFVNFAGRRLCGTACLQAVEMRLLRPTSRPCPSENRQFSDVTPNGHLLVWCWFVGLHEKEEGTTKKRFQRRAVFPVRVEPSKLVERDS